LCDRECRKSVVNWKCGNGVIEWSEKCDEWENNGKEWINCTTKCEYEEECGNGKREPKENCKTCPEDMWGKCKPEIKCWNNVVDEEEWEECDVWENNGKIWIDCTIDCKIKCGNEEYDEWENCETCPWDVKDPCVDYWSGICGDGNKDERENCYNCPEDVWDCNPNVPTPDDSWWNIQNDNCNICPCEYADYSTDLIKWDVIRAKLWDKSLSVLYRYSNSVLLENFLDIGL
jgi:hypothetical protein